MSDRYSGPNRPEARLSRGECAVCGRKLTPENHENGRTVCLICIEDRARRAEERAILKKLRATGGEPEKPKHVTVSARARRCMDCEWGVYKGNGSGEGHIFCPSAAGTCLKASMACHGGKATGPEDEEDEDMEG